MLAVFFFFFFTPFPRGAFFYSESSIYPEPNRKKQTNMGIYLDGLEVCLSALPRDSLWRHPYRNCTWDPTPLNPQPRLLPVKLEKQVWAEI